MCYHTVSMDNPADKTNQRAGTQPAAIARLAFRAAFLASLSILVLGTSLGYLLPLARQSLPWHYLRNLALVAAFGFSLSGWGLFFLDSMCGVLALAQAKFLTLAGDFLLALLSLIPLALILAAQRLASGLSP
jgi:hypothetical protein